MRTVRVVTLEDVKDLLQIAKENNIDIKFSKTASNTLGMSYNITIVENESYEQWYRHIVRILQLNKINPHQKDVEKLKEFLNKL